MIYSNIASVQLEPFSNTIFPQSLSCIITSWGAQGKGINNRFRHPFCAGIGHFAAVPQLHIID